MKPIFMTVQTVADWVGGAVEGNPSLELDGIAPLESAGARELTFATDEKWAARLSSCKAAAAIEAAVAKTTPKMKSQAAGRMGYSTSQIGDLVAATL